MTFYLGLGACLLGSFLIWRSLRHREQVLAARARAEANGGAREVAPQWQALGVGVLPFYLLYGAFASLLLIGGYFLTDIKDLISPIDLLGLLVLIAGYTLWMVIRIFYSTLGLDMKGA